MKWLADENIPLAAVERLRTLGHDVLWVAETARDSSDSGVLAMAVRDHVFCSASIEILAS